MPEQPPDDTQQRATFFERIAREHTRLLYHVAYSLLRHPQDAEDAVQDALLKLYRSDGWREIRDERAFLARLVWRAALDRRAARPVGVDEEYAEQRVADVRPSPELTAAETEERALLQELIDTLPEELRQPLLLSAMEEWNSREIGELLGLPEGTVRTRLMRARTQLKQEFEARNAAGREVAAGERTTR
jgi:RNA polymerase sigma-70 factor (ECF subfamily)